MILDKLKSSTNTDIDALSFSVDGVEVHAYGILHGITGGPNRDYVNAVNRAIESSPGVKYCEKSMKSMYKGLNFDVADWLVFRSIDTFKFAFSSFVNPSFIYHFVRTAFAEKTTKHSRFGQDDIYSLCDAASSLKFHSIHPNERREICGFPNPEEYLRLNVLRWENGYRKRFRFPDKDWAWLEHIEPNACIPLRSIHMLEYAITHAKANDIKVISIFCGELHNSDMAWYSTVRDDPKHFSRAQRDVVKKSAQKAACNRFYVVKRSIWYYAILSLGVIAALSPYLAIAYCLTK
ncbi:hypothetical protein LMH73_017540 [Vibrio splendidus]|nr:hypothetical protein [Vibrio splendidus]MCC4880340.1 hypothetical protein [Vibrio splendidus]